MCHRGLFDNGVMIPNGLTCGGLTGIVRIVQNYVNIDFSVLYYALAIVIWIIVILTMGFHEAKKCCRDAAVSGDFVYLRAA